MRLTRTLAPGIALMGLLAAPQASVGQAPAIGEDECLYLVGAPAGGNAAETEERTESERVLGNCGSSPGLALNRDRENQIQMWLASGFSGTRVEDCVLEGSAGHRFRYDGETPTLATIRMIGALDGLLSAFVGGTRNSDRPIGFHLAVALLSIDDAGEARAVEVSLDELSVRSGLVELSGARGAELQHVLLPGREYEVRLALTLAARSDVDDADFGRPGDGKSGATYDSIQVCTTPLKGGNATGDIELEALLHEGRCLAGIWLPEVLGGRLQEARGLVQLRIDGAAASGARGINLPVARRRLRTADEAIAEGDYQRACREFGHALRAVTTP